MSEGPKLTPSQRKAVQTTGCSLLVSASAGTGKTHVLAERCAYLVCDAKPPSDVDRLLVVTFTEAAAAEMRARIGQTIRRRLDAKPDSGRLRRQLALLDAATITTIHAFCLRLVRRWFARVDLDPNVEVLDADEAEIIRQETLDALFAELYASRGKASLADGFRGLVDIYGMGRDQPISRMVLNLHGFVQSLPNPAGWMREACERVGPGDSSEALPTAMAETRRKILLDRIEILGNASVLEADIVRALYPPGADYAERIDQLTKHLRDWYRRLRDTDGAGDVDTVIDAIAAYKPERMPSVRGLDPEAKQQRAAAADVSKAVHDRLKNGLQKRAGAFRTQAILDGLGRIGPHVATLIELTEEFERRYLAVKQAEGRIDFADLERFALDLLSADEAGETPSEVALHAQHEFDHVLVDEFQDVSPVQEAVLRLVSRETDAGRDDNLFAVGDVKQSIYRFRLAEPEIFARRAEAFAAGSDDGQTSKRRRPDRLIPLRENFRSRGEVLDTVNAVFERIMRPQLGGMTYDEQARLEPGAPYPADLEHGFARPAAELHLIEKDVDAETADADQDDDADQTETLLGWEVVEREAYLAGRRILELMGQADGHTRRVVCEKNRDPSGPPLRSRPIEFRDVVILLRSTKGKANHFERVLRNMGVPVYADLTTGYFTSLEVQDVLSLLRAIDNARQDIPMAAVIRSPLLDPPMSESQMVEIRWHAPEEPFHDAVRRYAENGEDRRIRDRLRDLFARLDRWRAQLRRQPLADVLWQILTETGYWAYVGGLRNGLQRRANLARLHERARQFSRFARQGLHRFLRFIEDLEERGRDPGVAPALSEAEDVVRIMSIHRSKGLEFPVVILADLGKQFNLEDARRTMLFERQRFIGLPVVELEQGVRYPTLNSLAVRDEIERQIRAEEMRICYVAMTRAREHLILIGTTALKDLERRRQRGRAARERGGVPLIDLLGARTSLDWLISAVTAMPDSLAAWSADERPQPDDETLLTVHQHSADAIGGWESPERVASAAEASLKRFADLGPIADADHDAPEVRTVIERITQPYARESLTAVPAVVAASEMKRRFADEQEPGERRVSLRTSASPLALPRFAVGSENGASAPTRLTPAERGTLTHLVMQHLELTRSCDVQDIAKQVDGLVERNLLTVRERGALAFEPLAWFFTTDLGRRLLDGAERVRREVPFVLGVSPDRIVPGIEVESADDEVVLVRGMIDCLLPGEEGDEVIDFKTDAIGRSQLTDRVAYYTPQIDIYAEAVQRIWGHTVAHRWLVFLSIPEIIDVPTGER